MKEVISRAGESSVAQIARGVSSKWRIGVYTDQKTVKRGIRFFRCLDRQCAVRGTLKHGVFEQRGQHNHPDHQDQARVHDVYAELKEKVGNSRRRVKDLYREALLNVSISSILFGYYLIIFFY